MTGESGGVGTGPGNPDLRLAGLLLGRDLIFQSKITGTARQLGVQVLVAGNRALALSMMEQWQPRAVFVDLAAGDLTSAEAILAYRHALPKATFIAFGSHVDKVALEAATAAGCDLVLPRSKFTVELPQLIETYLLSNQSL